MGGGAGTGRGDNGGSAKRLRGLRAIQPLRDQSRRDRCRDAEEAGLAEMTTQEK